MAEARTIPQDTITGAFARAVEQAGNHRFLDFSGEGYTFAEVARLTTEIAHGLVGLGIGPGDVVATILDNNIDCVTTWLAINTVGAVFAPVNTAFKGTFLRNQLNDCTAQVVIAEDEYGERVAEIAGELTHLRCLVTRHGRLAGQTDYATSVLDELRRKGPAFPVTARPEDLSMLIYTSGTTGPAKGCMLPHNVPCTLGWNVVISRGYDETAVLWSPLPLFHLNAIGATVMPAMLAKATAAISPRFSLSRFWPEIEQSGATTVTLLGSMASLIAEAPDSEVAERCRGQIKNVSAAPFTPTAIQKWRDRFGVNAEGSLGYGMSEAPTIANRHVGDPPAPAGSSGLTGRDYEVRIFDDSDEALPAGQVGEIVVRPTRPNIMFQGYWNRPADTVKVWRNLWFHTGDLGKLSEAGHLFFVDRKKDYIRRRGENISSGEMEAVFGEHPALADVAVHAVLSPLGEDEVKVTAQLKPGAVLSEEELCRWSIDRVPYFAVPLYIEFRDSLPRGATGKVLKEQLRAEGKTAATWDREAAGLTFERR
ncbi:MAG TPA: AMP-binding protein [Novosphingobium sp.]|nr:AMP-binding protein [Novosphingobium sp.]